VCESMCVFVCMCVCVYVFVFVCGCWTCTYLLLLRHASKHGAWWQRSQHLWGHKPPPSSAPTETTTPCTGAHRRQPRLAGLCLLHVLVLLKVRAVPIRIPKTKQKQSSLSGMFFRILFVPNHFNRNRNRNSFVPVTIESVTICDQNVTKSVLLKQLKKKQRNKYKFVTVCDHHKCHKLVTHSV